MGAAEAQAYLSHLATEKNVASATHNQTLNAIVFLYRDVLNAERWALLATDPAQMISGGSQKTSARSSKVLR